MHARTAFAQTAAIALLVAGCHAAAPAHDADEPSVGRSARALLPNGGFENGNLNGWTVEIKKSVDLPTTGTGTGKKLVIPQSINELNLLAATSTQKDRTKAVGGAGVTTYSQQPKGLPLSESLKYPFGGSWAAVVNEASLLTSSEDNNVNILSRSFTVNASDVDPADGKIHVRFTIAPVLEYPAHDDWEQPYFFLAITNVTKGKTLFQTFNYSNQPGVPWRTVETKDPRATNNNNAQTTILYTDWQLVDVAPGTIGLAIGDEVKIQIVAAACSKGKHFSEVYVDAFGSDVPGLAVVASAPQSVNKGDNITYVHRVTNGSNALAQNVVVTIKLPDNTTFASIAEPQGVSCTTPAVNTAGTVTCTMSSLNSKASADIGLTVKTSGSMTTPGLISHGTYDVKANAFIPLIGPLVTTNVTSGVTYADLRTTMTSDVTAAPWGGAVHYTVKVENAGPSVTNGASVNVPLPANLASATWTCTGTGGGVCNAATGSGAIATTVNLPVGASATFEVDATVAGSGTGSVVYTATATVPAGITDSDTTNDAAAVVVNLGTTRTLTVTKDAVIAGRVVSSPGGIDCAAGCGTATGTYLDGSQISLSAIPPANTTFVGWTGGACDGAATNPCVFNIGADTAIQANFGYVVASSVTGTGGTLSCTTPVLPGADSTCTITPDAGYGLGTLTDNGADVLGAVSGGSYVISNVQAPHSVVATFQLARTLTVNKNASIGGVASTPAGLDCPAGCSTKSASFAPGTQVTLTASAPAGTAFTGWSGGSCTGTTNPCVFTISANTTVQANFAWVVTSNVAGAGGTLNCNSPVVPGASSTCSISADPGYALRTLTDNATNVSGVPGAGGNYVISNVQTSHEVIATFGKLRTLTVEKDAGVGGSVTSTPAGLACLQGCASQSKSFFDGDEITLTAAATASGTVFTGWWGACTGTSPTCTFTIGSDTTVRANFAYEISSSFSGNGTISCTSPVAPGNASVCTVTPAPDSVLTALADNTADVFGQVSGGKYVVTNVQVPHAVAATFKPLRTLSVTKSPIGSVTSTPAGISCGAGCTTDTGTFVDGSPVSLAAAAPAGGVFSGWTGGACDGTTTSPCVFNIGADTNVTANFAWEITPSVTGANGAITCPPSVPHGADATCTITPAPGYELHTLTDNGTGVTGSGGGYTISNVQGAHTVVATFKKALATVCSDASECGSGVCADGVCCNSACDGQCEACDVAGSVGTCSPVNGVPHGDRDACDSDGSVCGGSCDGANTVSCTYPTVECTPASCAAGVATVAASCDGAGSCPATVTVACDPYVCGATACLDDCASDLDCVGGYYCQLDSARCEKTVTIAVSGPPAANQGMDVAYTYEVTNHSGTPSEEIVVTLEIPADTTFVSLQAPSNAVCTTPAAGGTGTIVCTLDSVDGPGSEPFVVTVQIDDGLVDPNAPALPVIDNDSYFVAEGTYDPYAGAPISTTVTDGARYADLGASVSSDVSVAAWSSPVTYTVVVRNAGPHAVDGAAVQAALPPEFAYATWTCASAGGTCRTASGSDGVSTKVDLPQGATATFVVRAWLEAGTGSSEATFTAAVAAPAGVLDGYPANDTASSVVLLESGHTLTVTKEPIGVVTSEPDHVACGVGCTSAPGSYLDGTQITLTATEPEGTVFTGWEGGGCDGETSLACTFTIGGDTSVTAHFAWVVASSVTGGNGDIDCPDWVAPGADATCDLIPDAGYVVHTVSDNGADVSGSVSASAYEISNAQGPHTVVVTFKKDLGTGCGAESECHTGICVDGVCCNTSCEGQCEACDVSGSEGTCSPATGAPRGDRDACDSDGSSCGGSCDGTNASACTYPGAETDCRAASCAAGVATFAASCAGTGSCPAVVTQACAPYVCGATACLDACTVDLDCVLGFFCDGGACAPKTPNGDTCDAANQCASGHCVDGVCCNSGCNGQCEACDVAGLEGTCSPVVGAPHGDRAECDSDGSACGGSCNGILTTGCFFPGQTTECRTPSCESGTAILAAHCDGAGFCPPVQTQACGGFACGVEQCDGDCLSDGDCAQGEFCSAGVCQPKIDDGALCDSGSQCASGNCVDGVCCDTACDGQCEACDVAGSLGTCSPVSGAPRGARAACASDGSACGGVCDGANAASCTYPDAGTSCRDASCDRNVAVLPAACDGAGHCPAPQLQACDPFVCGADQCDGDCQLDADCAGGEYCSAGVCVPQLVNGGACSTNDQCGSGLCVDGVCCDTACDGQCEACDVAGSLGTCSPVSGAPHNARPACASDGSVCFGVCDGMNADACAYPGASTECRAAACADGAATLGSVCNGAGACPAEEKQTCAPYVCGPNACLGDCDADVDCADGQYCSAGVCVPEKDNGVACSAQNQCASGECVDGVCCDTGCDGQCEACDVAGSVGTCAPVTGVPHGGRAECDSDGSACGGRCDGTNPSACAYPEAETTCRAAACGEGVATFEAVCRGDGTCPAPQTDSCGTYACGPDACLDACDSDADCADSAYCLAGQCRPRGDIKAWNAVGSGGCSSGGSGGGWWLSLLALALVVGGGRRRRAGLVALGLGLGSNAAFAQGLDRSFQANRFEPSGGAYDLLGVSSARVAPHHQLGATLFLNYAKDPLRLVSAADPSLKQPLLRHQLTADFAATVGLFDRVEISAVLPVAISQSADRPAMLPASMSRVPSGGLSDLRLVPKAMLFEGERVRLGVAVPVSLPLAREDAFLGHGTATVAVRGLAEWEKPDSLRVSGYVGNSFAKGREFAGLHVGTALQYGVGAASPFAVASQRFQALATATGERVWDVSNEPSPLEVTAAMRWYAPLGLDLTVGGGPGLTDGFGTPAYRLFAALAYTPSPAKPVVCEPCLAEPPRVVPEPQPEPEPVPEPSDRDGDGIFDEDDACPDVAGVASADPAKNGCRRVQITDTALLLLEGVRFETNRAAILAGSEAILSEAAAVLRDHPELEKVAVEGHTDAQGGVEFNRKLSEQRAAAVKAWLVAQGIDAERLSSVGHGLTRPIADNRTAEGRELNRRVEFRILQRAGE